MELNNNTDPIIELGEISNIFLATQTEIEQFENECNKNYTSSHYSPQINPLTMPNIINVRLPRKEDPWKNKKEHTNPIVPTNVSLPRKKLPWEK